MGTFFEGKSPGIVVPSSLQKQSGRTQTAGSQAGAEFGSLSMSKWNFFALKSEVHTQGMMNLPQEFSSEPSLQSFSPLQKSPRSMQFPSPQAR